MSVNLRTFREQRGLSQQDVERATGIPQRTISGIENGSEPMGQTLLTLQAWADNLAKKLRLPLADRLSFAKETTN